MPATHDLPFGLRESAFAPAPDERFLHLGRPHREALAHLLYGVGTEGGVVVLTGEIGAGKTTVCRCLLAELPAHVDVSCVADPGTRVESLLHQACRGFGIEVERAAGARRHIERLDAFLLANHARGRRSVLLIDEAQRLGVDLLEQLRLLTNLETDERKLLQVVLVGQPDLRELLARPELRQLAQRIVARCHLQPLPRGEVPAYVRHRLQVAGGAAGLVPTRLGWRLHAFSRGIPRTINLLCTRALAVAAARGAAGVDEASLAQAAREVGIASSAFSALLALAGTPGMPTPGTFGVAAITLVAAAAALVGVSGRADGGAVAPIAGIDAVGAAASAPVSMAPAPVAQVDARHASGWPVGTRGEASGGQAHAALLQRWGRAPSAPRGSGCAPPAGLGCLQGRAGLGELRALNLPAVLRLKDDAGRPLEALLQAVQDDAVTLRIAGIDHRLATDALAPRWLGDYTVLWPLPPGYRGEALRLGQRGPAVAWLRERLAQLGGDAAAAGGTDAARPFDAPLQAQLRAFQVREALEPDGEAGVKTLSRLAQRTDPAVPGLLPSTDANP